MKIRNIITIGLICAVAFSLLELRVHGETSESAQLTAKSYQIIETTNLNELSNLIKRCEQRMDDAHNMAEAARKLSYDEEHSVIILAQEEYAIAKSAKQQYEVKYTKQKKVEEANKFISKANSSPVAAQIWAFLKSKGYNDAVTAGILGNMMQECGGGTLSLNPYIYNPSGKYYGLCQWHINFGLHGTTIMVQLNYLANSLEETFNTYGRLYKSGFTYQDFCNLTSPEEAAKAYLYAYGRGSFGTCSKRQVNARVAYNYFVN